MAAPVILLMGPTASGKTDIAVELSQRLPVDIISVDSAMIYKGMDIGSAKPEADILAKAPHHLIDIIEPHQTYSAGQFKLDATALIHQSHQQGRIPLLTGGSMLYYHALRNLDELPSANPAIRSHIEQQAEQFGWAAMHTQLAKVSPATAERLHPNDTVRVLRALELYELTGQATLPQPKPAAWPWPVLPLALIPQDRAWLHARIEQRFDSMLKMGFLEEVRSLYQTGELNSNMASIRCVGYKQAWDYLDGTIDLTQMRFQGIAATRQLAKRQLTWLRNKFVCEIYDPQITTPLVPTVVSRVEEYLAAN